ncbi:MAG: tripartite tricarboxylate transporter permease [Nanoarchaeota archaeon]
MLIQIIVSLILGMAAGIFTGLTPGIHINLVGAVLVSLSASLFSGINPVYLVVFIVSMSIIHVFVDFIPSIFLGAPEDGTELSVMPGHEMLKKGLGFQAICLTSLGCLYGVFIFVLSIIPLSLIALKINGIIIKLIPFVLILISLSLVLMEKKKFNALVAFALSGILGLIVLNIEFKEPLLPMLSGLFGASSLILSIKSKTKIEKQDTKSVVKIKKLKILLTSSLVSPLSIFLPALSSGQIAVIGNQISKSDKEGFLFMLGIINTLAMSFSFLALFLLSKTRTGSAASVMELIGAPDKNIFILIIIIILISGITSFLVSRILARNFLILLEKINYTKLSVAVLFIITFVVFFASGFFGLIVLAVSTFTGVYCISLGVRRTQMMSCLLLPTIIIYLF